MHKEEWFIHFLLIQIWEIDVISKLIKHCKIYYVKHSISVLPLQLPLIRYESKELTQRRKSDISVSLLILNTAPDHILVNIYVLKLEAFKAMNIKIIVLWVTTPFSVVDGYQCY